MVDPSWKNESGNLRQENHTLSRVNGITVISNILLFVVIIFFGSVLHSQVPIQRSSDMQILNLSQIKYTQVIDEVALPQLAKQGIPYSIIKGSPFWNHDWQDAELYTSTGKNFSLPIRINLVTGGIHFLMKGEEFVISETPISKIVFKKENDSIVFVGNLPDLVLNKKKIDDMMITMNLGKYQLLKYIKRSVASGDSLFGTQKRYFFVDEIFYFLRLSQKIERIKKLNKENLLQFLPSANSYSDWIEQNHIDFKKETDVVRFLNHCNSTAPIRPE